MTITPPNSNDSISSFDPLLNEKPKKYEIPIGVTCSLESLCDVGPQPLSTVERDTMFSHFNFETGWNLSAITGKVTPGMVKAVQQRMQSPPPQSSTPPSTSQKPKPPGSS